MTSIGRREFIAGGAMAASGFVRNARGEAFPDRTSSAAAVEAAYRVGSRVVHALVMGWDKYAATPPSAPAK